MQSEITFDLASPGWLAAVREIVDQLRYAVELPETEFTVSEELTDAPIWLCPESRRPLGWSLRIQGGSVEIGHHPLASADVRVIADYETRRDLYRRPWQGDPVAMAASAQLTKEAFKRGRLRIVGELSGAPEPVRTLIAYLHDPVAAITK